MLPWLLSAATQAGPEIITLSGSSGTPNSATCVQPSGTARAGWRFQTDGSLDRNNCAVYSTFGNEWSNKNPPGTYYIRGQLDSGSNPTSGPTLGNWHVLTTEREWEWTQSSTGSNTGTLQIDIATDSGGTNIVATGYYEGDAEITT